MQQLEKFGLLETVALLDEQLDVEAQLWSRLLDPMLVARYMGTQQHEDVRQVSATPEVRTGQNQ